MAYAEGYKAFQLKFSPLIVRRAIELGNGRMTFMRVLLAGPYCMGLFGANKRRIIISWSISAGVTALVVIVKKLPYPWRSIVDGGVVVGLSYGTLSIVFNWLRSFGSGNVMPGIDPAYGDDTESGKKRN
jgi:hypothetical protein